MRSMVEGAATGSKPHNLTRGVPSILRAYTPIYGIYSHGTSGPSYSPPAVAKPRVTDEVAATETGTWRSRCVGFSLGFPVGEIAPRASHCSTNPVAESLSG